MCEGLGKKQKKKKNYKQTHNQRTVEGVLGPQRLELLGLLDRLVDDGVGELGHARDVDAVGLEAGAYKGLCVNM